MKTEKTDRNLVSPSGHRLVLTQECETNPQILPDGTVALIMSFIANNVVRECSMRSHSFFKLQRGRWMEINTFYSLAEWKEDKKRVQEELAMQLPAQLVQGLEREYRRALEFLDLKRPEEFSIVIAPSQTFDFSFGHSMRESPPIRQIVHIAIVGLPPLENHEAFFINLRRRLRTFWKRSTVST